MHDFRTNLLFCLLLAISLVPGRAARGRDDADASPSSWITWDPASDQVVSAPNDTGAAAPRARQLSNGEILLAYHHGEALGNCGSRVTLRRSRDGGVTWYRTEEIDGPRERGFWGFSNPDFIELGRGRLMLVSAARGKADPRSPDVFLSECERSGLRVRFSNDYGLTWGSPRLVAAGRGRVWEPSIVSLPRRRTGNLLRQRIAGPPGGRLDAMHRVDPLGGRRPELERTGHRFRERQLP